MKILTITNADSSAGFIKQLASDEMLHVDVFTTNDNGDVDFERLVALKPDAILLEVGGNVGECLRICRTIRAFEVLKYIPFVLVVDSEKDVFDEDNFLEIEADSIVSKSTDKAELMMQIRILHKARLLMKEKDDENKRLQSLVSERTRELNSIHFATLNLLEDLKNEVDSRRKTESALRESEARLLRAELASRSGNWEINLKDGVVIASKGALVLYGLSEADSFSYDFIRNFCLPEYRTVLDRAIESCVQHGDTFELEYKIKQERSGFVVDIHVLGFYNAEKDVLFGVINA